MAAIVLVGPMGAGKTSIGRKLAKRLGVGFADTDAMLVAEHGPIPQIFVDHGEPAFRAFEVETVARALESGGVVSLGGGAVLDAGTRELLAAHTVVLLTVSAEVAAGRVRGPGRPLLAGSDAATRWAEIADARRPLYDAVADATFDTSTGRIDGIADRIAAWVGDTAHVDDDTLASGSEGPA